MSTSFMWIWKRTFMAYHFCCKSNKKKNQQRPRASYNYFIFWMLCKIAIIYYASKPGKHWLCKADNSNAVETLSGVSGVHHTDKEFPCNAFIVIEATASFTVKQSEAGRRFTKTFLCNAEQFAAFIQWLLTWVSTGLRDLTQNLWALAQTLMNIDNFHF